MKLGAVDFIPKPFSPEEVRALVSRVLNREKLDEQKVADYGSSIELAKKSIGNRHLNAAIEHARKAIFLDPSRPEAFNLLGALQEIQGNRIEAQKNYRAALSLDPSYAPAIKNLERSTSWGWKRAGSIILEDIQEESKKQTKKMNSFDPARQRRFWGTEGEFSPSSFSPRGKMGVHSYRRKKS
jgi:tetratricopeptide (TPR) repeat protein